MESVHCSSPLISLARTELPDPDAPVFALASRVVASGRVVSPNIRARILLSRRNLVSDTRSNASPSPPLALTCSAIRLSSPTGERPTGY